MYMSCSASGRVYPTAACAASTASILQQIVLLCICPVLPLDMRLFYTIQPVLLMNMSALQQPVLPLDMFIYYLSLSCPLTCLFTAVN